MDEITDLTHSSMFLNWFPKPFCKENENYEAKLKKNEQRFASLQIVKIIEQLGNEKVFLSFFFF
jgi:cytoplasmic FMR1 interacting protein